MAIHALKKAPPKQLVGEEDRATLRDYLIKRLNQLRREGKRAGEKEEAAFVEGGEMEIYFIFDELLGEQPPEMRKKPRSH
jgi:hypothetical protein